MRNPEVDERSAPKKRVRSVASAHEARIHLRQYTLSDSRFRLRNHEWGHRRSTGRAFGCFEVTDLWIEHSSQRQNGRQRRAGPPLRSRRASRPSRIKGRSGAKLILLLSDIYCAERPSRANIRIHGIMGWIESRRSRPISPASGASVLAYDIRSQQRCRPSGR
jgi:hypothetical protein